MATKSRAEMIDWTLEHIGVKAASQGASAEDGVAAGRVIDSVYDRLRKEGLVPFTTAAFPEWSQMPFIEVVAPELAGAFGIAGERLQVLMASRSHGMAELARQVAGYRHPVRIWANYF